MSSTKDWLGNLKSTDRKPSSLNSSKDGQYTEASLKGIRVEHSVDEFEAGTSQVLVAQDVDVLAVDGAEDLRLVAPALTTKPVNKSRLTFSFEDEDEEDAESPDMYFVIGEETSTISVEKQTEEVKRRDFDTNLATTLETVSHDAIAVSNKKKARAVSRRKALFNEEPVFQPREAFMTHAEEIERVIEADAEIDDDDADLARAITEQRQRNMELLKRSMDLMHEAPAGDVMDGELKTTGRASIEMSGVSDFLANVKRPERHTLRMEGMEEDHVDTKQSESFSSFAKALLTDVQDRHMDGDSYNRPDESLVSSSLGVGKTLKLLQSRGKPLKLLTKSSQADKPLNQEGREVHLAYYDEFGNEVSSREAYKMLSHRFHGKNPGKNKEEKRLKKIAETKKARSAGMVDASAMILKGKPRRSNRTNGPKKQKTGQTSSASVPAEPSKKKPRIFGMQ